MRLHHATAALVPVATAVGAFILGAALESPAPPLVIGALIAAGATYAHCSKRGAGGAETTVLTIGAAAGAVFLCLAIWIWALSGTS